MEHTKRLLEENGLKHIPYSEEFEIGTYFYREKKKESIETYPGERTSGRQNFMLGLLLDAGFLKINNIELFNQHKEVEKIMSGMPDWLMWSINLRSVSFEDPYAIRFFSDRNARDIVDLIDRMEKGDEFLSPILEQYRIKKVFQPEEAQEEVSKYFAKKKDKIVFELNGKYPLRAFAENLMNAVKRDETEWKEKYGKSGE